MSEQDKATEPGTEQGVFNAPWEKSFDKILTPFEEFVHRQTTSGLLLMATAILAPRLVSMSVAGAWKRPYITGSMMA